MIVVEGVLPEIPEKGAPVKAISKTDLVMMTQHLRGKERTMQEFLDLELGLDLPASDMNAMSLIIGSWKSSSKQHMVNFHGTVSICY